MFARISFFLLTINILSTALNYQDLPNFNGTYVVTSLNSTNNGVICYLNYTGTDDTYIQSNNNIIKYLKFELTFEGNTELMIKFTDAENYRFTLPYSEPYPYTKIPFDIGNMQYGAEYSGIGDAFWIVVYRWDTNEIIFDTDGFQLIYTNMFIQLTTHMYQEKIYGLGERRQHFLYKSGQYSIWNKDQYLTIENGQPNGQLYGSHPMYLRKEQSGNYHIVFLRNSAGMLLTYSQGQYLQYQVMGGILEYKIFLGDTKPDNAIKQYHTYINGFSLHPFWSQGYHQCKWGWQTSQEWFDVWQTFNNLSLPLDTLWNDIDYMVHFQDFTIDTTRYNTSQMKIVTNLSDPQGVRWVPILDAGVAINTNANYQGLAQNVFIQSVTYPNNPLYGCVWPGITNFVDQNNPNSTEYWFQGVSNLTQVYDAPQPSGFWIDMNEYSNFVEGECQISGPCSTMGDQSQNLNTIQQELKTAKGFLRRFEEKMKHLQQLEQDEPDYPYPFSPTGPDHPPDEKTLSLNATHYNSKDSTFLYIPDYNLTEYDFHNLNGFLEGLNTNFALKNMGFQLPFIISRSTLFGSGKYVQHWTGDNGADWIYLQLSISEIFNFQLFGIPFTGADICGFAGNSSAELCARWMQVGLFYPFSRNHGSNDTNPHLPYSYPNYPYVLSSSRASMYLRYRFLKYYYHLFVKLNSTGSVFKPLFFEFQDPALDDLDTQFMLGDLMMVPVLQQGDSIQNVTSIQAYFPKGSTFYNFYNGSIMTYGNYSFTVPFNATIPMFIKSGSIVHYQNVYALRARDLNNNFTLLIALDSNLSAQGTILSIRDYNNETKFIESCIQNNCVLNLTASGVKSTFTFQLTVNVTGSHHLTLFDQIVITDFMIYGIYSNQISYYRLSNPWNITGPSSIKFSFLADELKQHEINI